MLARPQLRHRAAVGDRHREPMVRRRQVMAGQAVQPLHQQSLPQRDWGHGAAEPGRQLHRLKWQWVRGWGHAAAVPDRVLPRHRHQPEQGTVAEGVAAAAARRQ